MIENRLSRKNIMPLTFCTIRVFLASSSTAILFPLPNNQWAVPTCTWCTSNPIQLLSNTSVYLVRLFLFITELFSIGASFLFMVDTIRANFRFRLWTLGQLRLYVHFND